MLFRNVKYSDDKIMWFVLYPFLSQRMLRRSVRSGLENWIVLKEKFKSRSSMMLNLFKSREQRVQDALGKTKTLAAMQECAQKIKSMLISQVLSEAGGGLLLAYFQF